TPYTWPPATSTRRKPTCPPGRGRRASKSCGTTTHKIAAHRGWAPAGICLTTHACDAWAGAGKSNRPTAAVLSSPTATPQAPLDTRATCQPRGPYGYGPGPTADALLSTHKVIWWAYIRMASCMWTYSANRQA